MYNPQGKYVWLFGKFKSHNLWNHHHHVSDPLNNNSGNFCEIMGWFGQFLGSIFNQFIVFMIATASSSFSGENHDLKTCFSPSSDLRLRWFHHRCSSRINTHHPVCSVHLRRGTPPRQPPHIHLLRRAKSGNFPDFSRICLSGCFYIWFRLWTSFKYFSIWKHIFGTLIHSFRN